MSHQEHHHHAKELPPARCGVLTVSDTRTIDTDKSGQLLKNKLTEKNHQVLEYSIVPDDSHMVKNAVESMSKTIDCLIVTGGTGIARRDNTIQAVSPLFDRQIPGFGELFRMLSFEEIGAAAMLSSASAGVIGGCLVFLIPGSSNACRLAIEKLILPELQHMVFELTK
jgi:molybdenum cofactor biosynthesis protein B